MSRKMQCAHCGRRIALQGRWRHTLTAHGHKPRAEDYIPILNDNNNSAAIGQTNSTLGGYSSVISRCQSMLDNLSKMREELISERGRLVSAQNDIDRMLATLPQIEISTISTDTFPTEGRPSSEPAAVSTGTGNPTPEF